MGAVSLWGVSFVATKAALQEIAPLPLVTTRFALGTAFLFAVLLARGRLQPPRRHQLPSLALMGFLGVFVHQILQAYGLSLTTAVRTGWLIGLIPLWSALLGVLWLGERFHPLALAGLTLGLAGTATILTQGRATLLGLPSTRGDLLILASTLNWALYGAVGHRTLRGLGPTRATAWAMLLGWSMLLPALALVSPPPWPRPGPLVLGAVLFLGLGCSGLGYLLWYAAIDRLGATRTAAVLYLEPLVTTAAAGALLGEIPTLFTLGGGVLVVAGTLLVQRGTAPPRLAGPATSAATGGNSSAVAEPSGGNRSGTPSV